MSLLLGFLAALATYVVLAFVAIGLFTSGGGLMIAALIAYAVGAVVAAPRVVNGLAAAVYMAIVFMTVRELPPIARGLWVAPGGVLIIFLIAHAIGSVIASFMDPIWRSWKNGLLALLVFALPVIYVIVLSNRPPPGALQGGENIPAPR